MLQVALPPDPRHLVGWCLSVIESDTPEISCWRAQPALRWSRRYDRIRRAGCAYRSCHGGKTELPMPKKKMLVAGASGLVGYAAVQHFAQDKDWDVVGISRRIPAGLEEATILSVDLQNRAQCAEVFSQMHDVTHVIYAALYEKPGLVQGWRERDQMETNLAMLDNLFAPLEKVAKNLQHVSLLQGTKAYGVHLEPFPVPARERWPRHQHENFYWLQEDYLRERQKGKSWHWT